MLYASATAATDQNDHAMTLSTSGCASTRDYNIHAYDMRE
jgi:hypothetical protein